MGDAPIEERRRRDRKSADLPLQCRIPARPAKVRILDVSESGCRLDLGSNVSTETGATIVLDMPNGDRVEGEIVWEGSDQAGVRFRRPLSARTAVFLGLQKAPEVQVVVSPEPRQETLLHHWFRKITDAFG